MFFRSSSPRTSLRAADKDNISIPTRSDLGGQGLWCRSVSLTMGAQGPADWPPGMVLPRSIVPEPEVGVANI